MAYSKEMVYRSFALFLDYVTPQAASRILREKFGHEGAPAGPVIHKWAKDGECTEGMSWYLIREFSDPVRGIAANMRVIRQPTMYDQWRDETMVQLEEMQEELSARRATGRLDIKTSDLPRLIQSRQLLEGEATSRTEVKGKEANILGRIIRSAIGLVQLRYLDNKEVREAFDATIDYIGEEFARFSNYTGDPDKYEIFIGTEPGSRRLSGGSDRPSRATDN